MERNSRRSGKTLRLTVADSETVVAQDQRTDSQGRFRFDPVPANVPLELQSWDQIEGRWDHHPLHKRFFLPGEKRENARVQFAATDASGSSSGTSKARPDWLKERLESLTRDARLNATAAYSSSCRATHRKR